MAMVGQQVGGVPVRFRCNFSIAESIGQVIIWILLSIITLGLALMVFPDYFNKVVLNKSEVLDVNDKVLGKLDCQFNLASSIGHVIIWMLLIIVTLGLASFLFGYRVIRVLLNETRIQYY